MVVPAAKNKMNARTLPSYRSTSLGKFGAVLNPSPYLHSYTHKTRVQTLTIHWGLRLSNTALGCVGVCFIVYSIPNEFGMLTKFFNSVDHSFTLQQLLVSFRNEHNIYALYDLDINSQFPILL